MDSLASFSLSDQGSTISQRGRGFAALPNMQELFKEVLGNRYDRDKNPNGVVNIGTAENYMMFDEMVEYVKNMKLQINREDFSYGEGPFGSSRLREAFTGHINRHFSVHEKIDKDDVIVCNGVCSLCELLSFSLCDPGDGILFSMPCYVGFQGDFELRAKAKCVHVPFDDVDQFSSKSVQKYEEALLKARDEGTRIRGLMLCNPHNPTGRCYPKDTIIEIMKFCKKYEIHLMSDEIYALSVYDIPDDEDAVKFTSALSVDHAKYIGDSYLHVLYGMSKDLAGGGLRIGCCWTRNKNLRTAMANTCLFNWPGVFDQKIAAAVLEDQDWLEEFMKTANHKLAENNVMCRRVLKDAGIKVMSGANAGFFLWIDLRPWLSTTGKDDPWEAEDALQKKLMENKVFLQGGKVQAAEEAGFFRIIFSQRPHELEVGLNRLKNTLQ